MHQWTQVRHKKPQYCTRKPVSNHFSLSGHSLKDLKVIMLEQNHYKSRIQRETAEIKCICMMETHKNGLRINQGFLNHYHCHWVSQQK
ncbi:hypothetical protein JRQ81_015866, partial [Phrynocephalus forsythii]